MLTATERAELDRMLDEDIEYGANPGDLFTRAQHVYRWIVQMGRVRKVKLAGGEGVLMRNPLHVRTVMKRERRATSQILDLVEAGVGRKEVTWKIASCAFAWSGDRARALKFARDHLVEACKGGGVVGLTWILEKYGEVEDVRLVNASLPGIDDERARRMLQRAIRSRVERSRIKAQNDLLIEKLKKNMEKKG
jgi:hypothetical protein